MGQQGQGDVPVPARPAANLVVVQADLVLGLLEAVLDRPAGPGHPDQADQGGVGWTVAGVEGQLAVAAAAPDQQPALPSAGGWWGQLDARPVVQAAALGAVAGAG